MMKGRSTMALTVLALLLTGGSLSAAEPGGAGPAAPRAPFDPDRPPIFHVRVYLDPASFLEQAEELNQAGFDIAGRDISGATLDLIIPLPMLDRFRSRGQPFEYVPRDGEEPFPAGVGLLPGEDPPPGAGVLAPLPDQRYSDYGELVAFLDQTVLSFPAIAKKLAIGTSNQGRTIWALKISDNATIDEDETAILFNAQHHAREVMTPEVIIDMIQYLTFNYPSDPNVKRWVEDNEILLVPTVNPDGSNIVFTSDSCWRKNARDNNGDGTINLQDGVDLNRNYPHGWGGTCNGSSGSPTSCTYRGVASASEPEAQALINLADSYHFVFDVDYHSFGEDVFYSYSCDPVENPVMTTITGGPDQYISRVIGQAYAAAIIQADGQPGFTPASFGSRVDGTCRDYHYRTHGTISFVTEINSAGEGGFAPNYGLWRDQTVFGQRPGWQYLLDRIQGPSIGGHVTDAVSGAPIEAVVSLDQLISMRGELMYSRPDTGRYHVIVVPGNYTVRFHADGYQDLALPVTVGSGTAIADAAMQPLDRAIVFEDHLESPTGWTAGAASDTATDGIWAWGDPYGSRSGSYPGTPLFGNPEFDRTVLAGRQAFVTGNQANPTFTSDDLDGGTTTLFSPIIDLSAYYNLELSVARRFFKSGSDPLDTLRTEIATSGGSGWFTLETLTSSTSSAVEGSAWLEQTFLLDTLVPITSTMRLRFVATDGGPDDTIEAAVDDIVITGTDRMGAGLVGGLQAGGTTATVVSFSPVPGLPVYDVIRGSVSALAVTGGVIDLGSVVCIENDSTDTSTSNAPDTALPPPGEAFFYLARFNLGFSVGSYGLSGAGLERFPASGDCPQ